MHHARRQAGACLFSNLERRLELDPCVHELTMYAGKNGIRADAFLTDLLVGAKLMRIEIIGDLFNFDFG